MKRNSIGIDIVPEYFKMVKEKTEPVELILLEPKVNYEKTKNKRSRKLR
jgi:site-specific DNA-methyltransferase (adenine-specific)